MTTAPASPTATSAPYPTADPNSRPASAPPIPTKKLDVFGPDEKPQDIAAQEDSILSQFDLGTGKPRQRRDDTPNPAPAPAEQRPAGQETTPTEPSDEQMARQGLAALGHTPAQIDALIKADGPGSMRMGLEALADLNADQDGADGGGQGTDAGSTGTDPTTPEAGKDAGSAPAAQPTTLDQALAKTREKLGETFSESEANDIIDAFRPAFEAMGANSVQTTQQGTDMARGLVARMGEFAADLAKIQLTGEFGAEVVNDKATWDSALENANLIGRLKPNLPVTEKIRRGLAMAIAGDVMKNGAAQRDRAARAQRSNSPASPSTSASKGSAGSQYEALMNVAPGMALDGKSADEIRRAIGQRR